jgi:hypothetical protein
MLKKEVKGFGVDTSSCRCAQIGLDGFAMWICVTTPNDAQRGEKFWVD